MKKLRLIIPILLICLLLNGCGFFLPFFYLNFSGPMQQEEVAELPIGADVDTTLSAEDIYYRAKLTAKDRALQYSEDATIALAFTDDVFDSRIDMHYNTNVALDPDSSAVNVQTLLAFGDEEPDIYWDYYRDENGRLIWYYYDTQNEACTREDITPEDMTPYVIIIDYTVYGYPLNPQDLWLAPQTRILNDREVYMLTYTQSALYTFGSTGNTLRDEKLGQRYIPATWYVDAETYLPLRQEYHLTQVDDLLGELISDIYQISEEEMGMAIAGYALAIDYTAFDPVELPPIPDEVMRKAWHNAGFSAS